MFCTAECDRCILSRQGTFKPVPTETHGVLDLVGILSDCPDLTDVDNGRPLCGMYGSILQNALDNIGVPRERLRLISTVACRPSAGDLKASVRFTNMSNRKHAKEPGYEPLLTPMQACRPRLLDDLQGLKYIIAMGDFAMKEIRGHAHSIDALRGTCETITPPWARAGVKVGYTYHPSRVIADSIYKSVFNRDIAKSFRFFSGRLKWTDPDILICKSSYEARLGFARLLHELPSEPVVSYDIETEGKYALYSRLRCISFGNRRFSMVIPFLSIDGVSRFMPMEDQKECAKLVKQHLKNPPWKLIGHNAGVYDRLSIEKWFKITPRLDDDTILLDLLASNDGLPHRLGFLGSYRTDMPEAWKADSPADEARSDEELHIYNAKDSCVTVHVHGALLPEVKRRKQEHLVPREKLLQSMGANMQRIGMKIDIAVIQNLIDEAKKKADTQFTIIKSTAGIDFNPRSTHQMGKILFKDWGLLPAEYSDITGEPSTGDDSLRTMLINYGLPVEQRTFIQAIRMFRKHSRRIDTLLPLTCRIDQKYKAQGKEEEREGSIGLDGRAHPGYSRLPASGRFSSSDPFNAQNIEEEIRAAFIPEDGHTFIGCDSDQLEARYIAEEAKATRMLSIFNGGLDLHNETMELVYGPGVWTMQGAPLGTRLGKGTKASAFFNTRGVTKNTRYAWQYAAEIESIWLQVTSAEDKDGKLLYPHITRQDIQMIRDGLNTADPEIPAWWKMIRQSFKRQGFIADTLWGRCREFKGKTTLNEWVNHPIQAGGFHMVAEALLELVIGKQAWFATVSTEPVDIDPALLQWDFEKHTGLITQTHDSSLWEVPEDRADEIKVALGHSMTRRRKVDPMLTYTADAKRGNSWIEV